MLGLPRLKLYDIIHFFTGLTVGILNSVSPLVGLQGIILFISYELLEQLRIHDKSYRDVLAFGLGWGCGIVPVLWGW